MSLPPEDASRFLEWRALSRRDVVYRPGLFFYGVGQIDITDRLDLSCGLPNKTDNVSLRVSGILRSIVPNSAVFSIGIGSQDKDQRSLILKLDEMNTSVLIVDGQNKIQQNVTLVSSVVDGQKHWFEVRLIASNGSFTSLRLTIDDSSDEENFQERRFNFEDDKVFLGGSGVFNKSYFAGCLANFSLILNGCDLFHDADIYDSSNGGYNPVVVTGGCPNVCRGLHFHGAGYLEFNSSQFTEVNGFSMRFRPSSWNGTILFIRWKTGSNLSVWLSNGAVFSRFCMEKRLPDCVTSHPFLVSCDSFFPIELSVTNELTLRVGDVRQLKEQGQGNLKFEVLKVGGDHVKYGNFAGCVTDLRIYTKKDKAWTKISLSTVYKSSKSKYVSFAGCPCRSDASVAETNCSATSSIESAHKTSKLAIPVTQTAMLSTYSGPALYSTPLSTANCKARFRSRLFRLILVAYSHSRGPFIADALHKLASVEVERFPN